MGKGGHGRSWGSYPAGSRGDRVGYQESGPSKSENSWGRSGGKKGGRVPWSFLHVCDAHDTLGLLALSEQILEKWVDWHHGGKRSPERMHSTVILKMMDSDHLPRLERLASGTSPVKVSIREIFFERVDRITDAEVYCIGVGLASPGLRQFKDAWTAEEQPDQRKIHVPYDSEGHISLAYILPDYYEQARRFVEEQKQSVVGRAMTVHSITYQDAYGRDSSINFAGAPRTADSSLCERAVKGARCAASSPSESQPFEIDGSMLEGGGQILRMSSAYAALLGASSHNKDSGWPSKAWACSSASGIAAPCTGCVKWNFGE